MSVITEADLRSRLGRAHGGEITLSPADLLTPSAKDYIREQKLTVIYPQPAAEYSRMQWRESSAPTETGYTDEQGRVYPQKPEHMTHLHGRVLVAKIHPRIVLRGKLDSVQAYILQAQLAACQWDGGFVEDLDELLKYTRQILAAEVRDVPFGWETLLGLSEKELRAVSHHPQEQFGIAHFLPSHRMGAGMVALNLLRTQVREAELAAVAAFSAQGEDARTDLIQALNRLSSAVYILMCRALSQRGDKGGKHGH